MFRKSHRDGVSEGIWVDVARGDGPGGHPLGGGSRLPIGAIGGKGSGSDSKWVTTPASR